jgi:polar amino acid transport system substrate-binding protein
MRGAHFFSCAFFALLVSCAGRDESALARVQREGLLRWGGDTQGGEPYVYRDPSDPTQLIGFEVELADALARELGVRAEFVQQDWSNLVASMERGSFDVAMNGLEVTPARAERVLFTRPYYVFAARLVARRDDASVTDLASLRGRRVGTLSSSFSSDLLHASGAETINYEGVREPYDDLVSGRLDAVLLDDIISDRYGLTRPALAPVADLAEGLYSIAVPRGEPELRDALDQALERLARSGELRHILERWHLDGPRQERLVGWSAADTAAMVRVGDHHGFTAAHALLFFKGAGITLAISALAMLLAVSLGLVLALTRMYAARPLAFLAQAYVELFRGTPVLLQLYVLYFGVMASMREALTWHAGTKYDALVAAVVGLGLNYAAYEAEIYRAGIQAVPSGQLEASRVLGLRLTQTLRRIVVPQAARIALPGVTNDFIALLKDSSLVSVITVVELTKQMNITAIEVGSWIVPGLFCAGLYLAMSYPLSLWARALEARLARDE